MSQEKLNHVVCGALYDFVMFVAGESLILPDDVERFLNSRNVEVSAPLSQWPDRCSKVEPCEGCHSSPADCPGPEECQLLDC